MNWKLKALLLAIAGVLGACANPARSYATKHPELSAEHRKILLAGKVPDGPAVAGMTKEEVRLAMGADPDQFTKIDGVDAWVYLHYTGGGTASSESGHHHGHHKSQTQSESGENGENNGSAAEPTFGPSSSATSNTSDQPPPASATATPERHISPRTTIFFNGDHATHAEITRE